MLLLRKGNSIKEAEHMITDNRYSGPDEIRDQRIAPQTNIDHGVILDWLPVIGQTGFALYSIYMSLAAQRLPSPGIRRLANHIGAGPQSIRFSNRVLEWAGLIAITPGDQETSNTYDILDVPPVTDAALERIAAAALADSVLKRDYASYYRRRLLAACQSWQPFWQRRPGMLRPANDTPAMPAPRPAAVAAPPPDNASIASRLAALSMTATTAADVIGKHDPAYLTNWLAWMEWKLNEDPGYFRHSAAGYLLRVLEKGDDPPPLPVAEHMCSACQRRPVPELGDWCSECKQKYSAVRR